MILLITRLGSDIISNTRLEYRRGELLRRGDAVHQQLRAIRRQEGLVLIQCIAFPQPGGREVNFQLPEYLKLSIIAEVTLRSSVNVISICTTRIFLEI